MGRNKSPQREEAKEIWINSGGLITVKELAERLKKNEPIIRRWKKVDNWQEELDNKAKVKREKGGQPRNKNAITHGAYAKIYLEDLSSEEREYIESITLDTKELMQRQLQLLSAKEAELQQEIQKIKDAGVDTLYINNVTEMQVPKEQGQGLTTMVTKVKESAFERKLKLEAILNKTRGRIIKLTDSIKSYEIEQNKLNLEERKHRLMKQRITGEYDIDLETGEVIDDIEREEY